MGFGKDNKGQILINGDIISLGTLADRTALKQDNPRTFAEDFRLIKIEGFVSYQKKAAAENFGPIYFGVCSNELTVAEIKECLDVDGPIDRDDRSNEEKATRPVWLLAQFGPSEDEGAFLHATIDKTIRWTFCQTEGHCYFAFNHSGAALNTADIIRFQVKEFGVWVT